MKKATDQVVTQAYLDLRTKVAVDAGWEKPKWIEFCERMLVEGYDMTLYEARESRSKYITVWDRSRKFKVRFSNHGATHRGPTEDCDFFVGRNRFGTFNTGQAIAATLKFFKGE